jgi:FkbM family methyltransferase
MSSSSESVLDILAVSVAKAARLAPYGGFFTTRKLASILPGLRRYPLRTRYGRIVCDLSESVCYPLLKFGEYPHWRPDEEAWARLPIGSDSLVLDIGANIGVMTRLSAARAGRVHAFEPAPRALPLLEANTADLTNVTVHAVALSNVDGSTRFRQRAALDESSIGEGDVEVPVRTLDSFGFVPDLIKIDVEGYEHRVLEGATEMLQRAPVILFEALSETARQYCENIILAANPRYGFETIGWGTNDIAWPNR